MSGEKHTKATQNRQKLQLNLHGLGTVLGRHQIDNKSTLSRHQVGAKRQKAMVKAKHMFSYVWDVMVNAIPPLLGGGPPPPTMYIVHLGPSRALYGRKASEASPAKRSEPVWTEIHIRHTKTYT